MLMEPSVKTALMEGCIMNYNDVKNDARHLLQKDVISYSKALVSVSKKHGFKNLNSLYRFLKK